MLFIFTTTKSTMDQDHFPASYPPCIRKIYRKIYISYQLWKYEIRFFFIPVVFREEMWIHNWSIYFLFCFLKYMWIISELVLRLRPIISKTLQLELMMHFSIHTELLLIIVSVFQNTGNKISYIKAKKILTCLKINFIGVFQETFIRQIRNVPCTSCALSIFW